MLSPVMPASCAEIRRRLGEPSNDARPLWEQDGQWRENGERVVVSGPALWPRLEAKETVVSEEIKPGSSSPAVSQADGTGSEPAPAAAPPPAEAASLWPLESRIS